jgi:uncharacterized OB-fold protein
MSTKPLPKIMGWDKGFWESAQKGILSAQQCEQCQNLQLYPRAICLKCFSRKLGWKTLSGKGKVYAFSATRIPRNPAFKDDAPMIFSEIELEEGIRMHANIIDCAPEDVELDAPVHVVFKPTEKEEIHLPYFVLA